MTAMNFNMHDRVRRRFLSYSPVHGISRIPKLRTEINNIKHFGKTSELPPLMNILKRFFFDGAYIEKWGMVFWGESNKEEF